MTKIGFVYGKIRFGALRYGSPCMREIQASSLPLSCPLPGTSAEQTTLFRLSPPLQATRLVGDALGDTKGKLAVVETSCL